MHVFSEATRRHQAGDLTEARRLYQSVLAERPDDPDAAFGLSMLEMQQGHAAAALQLLEIARTRSQGVPHYHFVLGHVLQMLGRWLEAGAAYRTAIDLRPSDTESLRGLAHSLRMSGNIPAAVDCYRRLLELAPDSTSALTSAAMLLRDMRRMDPAEDLFRRATVLEPRDAVLHDNLGSMLKDVGDLEGSIDCYRRAQALDPSRPATHSNLAFALMFHSPAPAPILDVCRAWNARFCGPPRTVRRAHPNTRDPERRLRVGYVSPDFRDHCQSLFMLPLLARHDHTRFEIFAYSGVERPDGYTQKARALVDTWREARALSDETLAALILEDGIDVLVDLTMHMAGNRLPMFARRPAPLQVTWLAYPGTTGLDAMDYRITDPRLDPPGFDAHYTERSIRLPDSFWCYDPLTDGAPVNGTPALERGFMTFGCLNNPCKLTPAASSLWAGVLKALPGARMLLLAYPGRHRERLARQFAALGIDAGRLDFVSFRRREEYLRSYHDIDICLDTFPYNGHTTSLDAFWMGVPVITRVGETCAGRAGLSQLHQLGLTDLAAASDQEFIDCAVALAQNLPRLARLRQELRTRLESSPLMDSGRFCRHLENAYREIWRDYCGAPAEGGGGLT